MYSYLSKFLFFILTVTAQIQAYHFADESDPTMINANHEPAWGFENFFNDGEEENFVECEKDDEVDDFSDEESPYGDPPLPEAQTQGGLIEKERDNGYDTTERLRTQSHIDVEPSSIVNGSVNVITGQYVDYEIDFKTFGAEPFSIERNYVSADTDDRGPFGKGWNRNYYGRIEKTKFSKHAYFRYHAVITESGGATYSYRGQKENQMLIMWDSILKLVTNCGSGHISGRTTCVNHFLEKLRNGRSVFKKASGERLIFGLYFKKNLGFVTEEKRPNGNYLQYMYFGPGKVGAIEAFNSSGKTLGKLNFLYERKLAAQRMYTNKKGTTYAVKPCHQISVKHNDRTMARYVLRQFKGTGSWYDKKTKEGSDDHGKGLYISEAHLIDSPTIYYDYSSKKEDEIFPKVACKRRPEGRYLATRYYVKGENRVDPKHIVSVSNYDSMVGRVKYQLAPVGPDNTPIKTYRYLYNNLNPLKGTEYKNESATVYDAYGHKTIYKWNHWKRLTELERYTGKKKHKHYSTERLFWGSLYFRGNSRMESLKWLQARTCQDADGFVHFMRCFDYDWYGNVIRDELFGNLSGKNNQECKISENGKPEYNGCEYYRKEFQYSNDGLFLVTSMKEGETEQLFEYKRRTDLLISKLHRNSKGIYKREFYAYDEDAVLVQEIEDDGSSSDQNNLTDVTERRIRKTKIRQEIPTGLPEEISELYLDLATGQERLLKKTLFHYSPEGRLIAQDLLDANQTLVCTFTWEYNAMGNVSRETNSMGQETIRKYDINKNKIYEQGPNKEFHKEFAYDYSNRLIRVDEVRNDGTVLTESYKYNYLNQKVASTDIYGNETKYAYDDFGHMIQTIHPPVPDQYGRLDVAKDLKTYNIFNVPEKVVDCNGNVTTIETNIRGKPIRTVYPDGSVESALYNLDGTVKSTKHRNGSYTKYEYDHVMRLTKKSLYDSQDQCVELLSYEYNTFHLVAETDAGGNVKSYTYDYAGRLSEMTQGESRTTYHYDSLGRLEKTVEYDGAGDSVAHVQSYDLLDRVVEERQEDAEGNCLTRVSYEFDEDGNQTTVKNYSEKGESTTNTTFDCRHQPIKIVDAEGQITHIVYKYDYLNAFKQTVAYTQTTDPMGMMTEHIYDTRKRLAEVVQWNSFGELLHKKQFFYDLNGNKVLQEDSLTSSPGVRSHEIITTWTYDCMNREVILCEAYGTREQKSVETRYHTAGEKSEVIKADGVRLHYTYDALGRLSSYYSSDNSVDYRYQYDKNGNLLSIEDKVLHMTTERTYDKCGRLAREILGNGMPVEYTYDGLNRPRFITFPDKSGVEYVYKAHRLSEIYRLSQAGQREYGHQYDSYDQEDKLLGAKLIGLAGRVSYEYDRLGRSQEVKYDAWKELITQYDAAGNILEREIEDPQEKLDCRYRYDDLNQIIEEKEGNAVKHSYACDSLFNRITKNGTKLKLNKLNQLIDDSQTRYFYDPNGNLIKKISQEGKQEFKYDALDRLVEVRTDENRVHYTYDAQNRRLSKRLQSRDSSQENWKTCLSVNFLYIGQNEVGAYNFKGVSLELRLLGLSRGAEIGGAVAVELQGTVYAPLHDHLGNVTALVDANSGEIAEFYRYSAFGEESLFDAEGNALEGSLNPWRYSSKRVDSETGFIYFGRRYYDPPTGRWVTPDPIGRAGGPNCYAYVFNRPLTHVDLYGLFGTGGGSLPNFSTVCSYISSGVSTVLNYVGRGIDVIGFHFVPIPIVREALQIFGRGLSGQGMEDFHFTFMGKHVKGDLGLSEPSSKERIIFIGGICNTRASMISGAETISQKHGGCNVHYYAAASDGFVLDLVKAFLRGGFRPLASDASCADLMSRLSDDVGGARGGGTIYTYSHSQGAILTHNLTHQIPEICKNLMDVNAFGAAKILESKKFKHAHTFISLGDAIPFVASPAEFLHAGLTSRRDVTFLKPRDIPFYDHIMASKTYDWALDEAVKINTYKMVN